MYGTCARSRQNYPCQANLLHAYDLLSFPLRLTTSLRHTLHLFDLFSHVLSSFSLRARFENYSLGSAFPMQKIFFLFVSKFGICICHSNLVKGQKQMKNKKNAIFRRVLQEKFTSSILHMQIIYEKSEQTNKQKSDFLSDFANNIQKIKQNTFPIFKRIIRLLRDSVRTSRCSVNLTSIMNISQKIDVVF